MSEDNIQIDFGTYGKVFQEKVVQALLLDHSWASRMSEVIKLDYFEKNYLKFLAGKYFDYYAKYKVFPTLSLLVPIIRDELKVGNDEILREQIVEFLVRIKNNPDLNDLPYIKEKSLDFCQKQAFKEALFKSVDLIKQNKMEEVISLVKNALSAGQSSSVGHNFFEEMEARHIATTRTCVPTGIKELDKKGIMNGGLSAGEIGVILSATGIGKSHFLVHLGANALRNNLKVVHYTFELSWRYTGIRYDSNFCDIPSDEIIDRKLEVSKKYDETPHGKLIIKEFPARSCSVLMLKHHLEKLQLKSFVPDLCIIDYADLLRSSKAYNEPRHELRLIYEELRGLGQELKLPIWTASQSTRESSKEDVIDVNSIGEAYSKAQTADVVISLSRKTSEKASGYGRMFMAKNRAGKDGLIYPIKIDTSKSKIEVLSDASENFEEIVKQNEDLAKQAIRRKWQEIQKEKEFKNV